MRVMDELTEAHRRTPSFQHAGAQSPRVGACVGAFFNLFDWGSSKRFSSTKRITAERPNSESLYAGGDRSFAERTNPTISKPVLINKDKDEASPTLKTTPTVSSLPSPASVKSYDTGKRVPGVVARLMGLESLPDGPYPLPKSESQYLQSSLACDQIDSSPLVLQELLRQEFQQSKKSQKDKLPGLLKKPQDSKPARVSASQRKKSTGHYVEHSHPYSDSRAPRPSRPGEKKTASTQEDSKVVVKQPFLSRLQTGTSPILSSKSQSFNSTPLLSPAMLGGKNTMRLLEAAVSSMQPSPRSRYCLARDSHRDTQSESSVSVSSEKRVLTSGSGRGGRLTNPSNRSVRSQALPRSEKAEHCSHISAEVASPGSRSSKNRHESCKQDQASRRRFEMGLVASAKAMSPQQTHRTKVSNLKRVENSSRHMLGSRESATHEFQTDLVKSDQGESRVDKKRDNQEFDSFSSKPEAHFLDKVLSTPPRRELTDAEVESPIPSTPVGNVDAEVDVMVDFKADLNRGSSPSVCKAPTEKSVSGTGFRSIRFRGRSLKLEKDVGGQGNRVFPSDKHPVEKSTLPSAPKNDKATGAGFSYSMLFSGRKRGDKEGNDKGEALVMKRTDSTLMRTLLRRPSSIPGPSPVSSAKTGSHGNVKKNTKPTKKIAIDEGVRKVETSQIVTSQQSSLQNISSEPVLPLPQTHLDSSPQARFRSIDDVYPVLPMVDNEANETASDLEMTIQPVKDQFPGFEPQGDQSDCLSVERSLGKSLTKDFMPVVATSPDYTCVTSPMSPEVFVTECGSVPGTFPNSPMAKYEKIFFSSRNHLNLQDMFEVVSGDRAHELTCRRQSFYLSGARDNILASSNGEGAETKLDAFSIDGDARSTPERLEIQNTPVNTGWSEDVMVTPPALKKFELKGQCSLPSDVSRVEECGQPSPVSVLENPFLDESPLAVKNLHESRKTDDGEEQIQKSEENVSLSKVTEMASLEMVETEKIKQAILDISRFRNIDVKSIGLESPTIIPVNPQQELNYVREVLDAANLLKEESECRWFSADSPMNRSLFDRLEFGSIKLDERILMESKRWASLPDAPRPGSGLRSERKLLFDSINEVLMVEPWMKTSTFYVDLPMFPDLHCKSKFRSPISGELLVREVYRMICHWKEIAGNVLDDLIDYDMNVPEGRWVDFSEEVADIGVDIERTLIEGIIEEVARDLSSNLMRQSFKCEVN